MIVSKTKILLVVRWPGGGIRTFLRYVYRHFEPDLFEITIIGPNAPEVEILREDLRNLDIEIIKVSKQPSFYEFFKAIFKLVTFSKYDLIHSQGFTSGICAAIPARIARTPHILTSHDILSEKQFLGITGYLKKALIGTIFSMIPTIHSVSFDAQENLLEFFPSLNKIAEKCVVIRNGIEVGRFINVEQKDFRLELEVGDDSFLIGFLGRFMSQKGFVYLVDAMEELTKHGHLSKRPLVVTFGEGEFIREEKAKISKRGLQGYFRFLPFTPNVASVIKALDLVVMPSLWEACPLLAMETLVAGTPLIATDCIGLREVVRDTPAYVIPTRNVGALAEGIRLFIKKDRKEEFSMFAKEAASRFDVRQQADKIKQLISEKITR